MEIIEEYEDRARVESVTCPWCGTNFEQRPGPNCTNCGGPLPNVAGAERGDAPADAPRTLPKGFKMRMLVKNNWQLHIGGILMLMTLPGLKGGLGPQDFMILVGLGMIGMGVSKAFKRFDVLVHGKAVEGVITEAGENKGESVNGRHPYFIKYQYEADGKTCSGYMNCWDEASTTYREGDPVWVVYMPDDTDYRSSIWPPVA